MLSTARQLALCSAAYVGGFLVMLFVFVLTNGIDGNPNDALPYYAVFGVLLGSLVGRWWLLPFPALHLYVVDPIHAMPDQFGPMPYVLAGTVGIAAGVLIKLASRRRTARTSAASVQHH